MKFEMVNKRSKILEIKKYKNFVSSKLFIIRYNECSCNCLMIVNLKKNCKTSVGRNKMKRRIKEILRKFINNNIIKSISIYSKSNAFKESFSVINEDINHLMTKIYKEPIN